MRSSVLLSVVITTIGLSSTSRAHAQEPGGTPNYPPPGSGTPSFPPPPNAPPPDAPPVAPVPAAPAPYREGGDQEPKDEGRVRGGFNFNGGIGTGNNSKGFAGGLSGRLGWQLNHLMAIYGQISLVGWVGATDKKGLGQDVEFSAITGWQLTPMFSLTPVDLLELAAGPSLDRLSGGSAGASIGGNTVSAGVSAFSGFYFGVHGRAALHIGGKPSSMTGRRVSFTIGFDVHPTFGEGTTITLYTLGLGADWY